MTYELKTQLEEQLNTANAALINALHLLEMCNSDGQQCDYCTAPRMGNIVDRILDKTVRLDKKWYQKEGKK